VDDVTFVIDHNVAVVAVTQAQNVHDHRVGSHRFHKVIPGLLELQGILIAILVQKVGVEAVNLLTTKNITRDGARDDFDDSALRREQRNFFFPKRSK